MGYIGRQPGYGTSVTASDTSFDSGVSSLASLDINSAVLEVDTKVNNAVTKLDTVETSATADQTKPDIDLLEIDAGTVNSLTVETAVPVGAVFTDTVHDATASDAAILLNTAKETNVSTDLGYDSTTMVVSSSDGTDAILTVVDGTNAGLMTVAMKDKLDGIAGTALTDAEVATKYEGNADTNKYTDADKAQVTKLTQVEEV